MEFHMILRQNEVDVHVHTTYVGGWMHVLCAVNMVVAALETFI